MRGGKGGGKSPGKGESEAGKRAAERRQTMVKRRRGVRGWRWSERGCGGEQVEGGVWEDCALIAIVANNWDVFWLEASGEWL